MIKNKLANTDWDSKCFNKSATQMVNIFSVYFLDIMKSLIPNKIVTINDKDAPWVTSSVKASSKKTIQKIYTEWVKKGRDPSGKEKVKQIQRDTNRKINEAKDIYIKSLSNKLCDPSTGHKSFWSAYKRLENKKKITNIPPLLENGKYEPNFKNKAHIFNGFFAAQCRPFDNESVIPPFSPLTESSISNVTFTEDLVISVINKLNTKKAHGHDGISIAMLKLCTKEVAKPLCKIYKKCIDSGSFPSEWKLANVQPVHKKNSRQEKTNYRPISLLPICGKFFEKIVFDSLYAYLITNGLLSKKQLGFRPGDSTINQLLAITTEIYNDVETLDETRAVFLDISKAFDKVWHEGLLFKLRNNGIKGNLLLAIEDFLSNRKQRVVLNGVDYPWESIHPRGQS